MLRLYNTLSKRVEEFISLTPGKVTLYQCGPTVYDYAHIGNFRTYTMTDLIVRTLKYLGYEVKFVSNVTDVGHLVSDGDTGEDKLEKGAAREGKTAWEIAEYFTRVYIDDAHKLNITDPQVRPRPTQLIPEQIEMVKKLWEKGYAYKIDDGIYFDTSKLPNYGELVSQNRKELLAGARIEPNPQKRNLTDFALWKLSPPDSRRQMEWDSPWGKGFPGWHIECSVMSSLYLGDQIDIHTGGADLIPIHHTNEIAQSEAVSGKHPFVRYWLHGQFMQVDGAKMSKSKGNFYSLADIENKGFGPLTLRYLYLTAHYRSFLNFTWTALTNAGRSLNELYRLAGAIDTEARKSQRTNLSAEKLEKIDIFRRQFRDALENDLNIPQALSVIWEMAKSNIPSVDKMDLLGDFDQVLGLRIIDNQLKADSLDPQTLPDDIRELLTKRQSSREKGDFAESDKLRIQIEAKGYLLEDLGKTGYRVKKNTV